MALHEQSVGKSDEWWTPPHVFEAMGCTFDTDVASPGQYFTPWIPASNFITKDSLETPWEGYVWMNPPFGGRNGLVPWLDKFVEHGDGVALVPDRTSAPWWQNLIKRVETVLFVSPKLKFIDRNGQRSSSPPQGTCLVGIGREANFALDLASEYGLGVMLRVPEALK